jgi:hypothetical protein
MLFAVLFFLWTATVADARPILFARTPHVSQGKIVFSRARHARQGRHGLGEDLHRVGRLQG